MTRPNHNTKESRDDPTTDRTQTAMGDISHTHPYSDEGAVSRPFQRGPVVAADGGSRDARREEANAEDAEEEAESAEEKARKTRMKDIDHTPPAGEGVDRVFERGNEHTDPDGEESEAAEFGKSEEPVVSEE